MQHVQRRIIEGTNWIEELLPHPHHVFFPLVSIQMKSQLHSVSQAVSFWPFQCHQSQEAGGASITQMMPRAKDPKDICRTTVSVALWHALHWFICKISFTGDSPNRTPASSGLTKCLDQRSWAAGFEKNHPNRWRIREKIYWAFLGSMQASV